MSSIWFHQNITVLVPSERIEVLPAVNNRSSVDFLDALKDSSFKLPQRLDSDMPQEASRQLAEQSLDDVEP